MAKYADIDDLGSRYGCDGVGGVSVDGIGLRLEAEVDDGEDGESGRVWLAAMRRVELRKDG